MMQAQLGQHRRHMNNIRRRTEQVIIIITLEEPSVGSHCFSVRTSRSVERTNCVEKSTILMKDHKTSIKNDILIMKKGSIFLGNNGNMNLL